MTPGASNWLAALLIALIAHLGLAIGLGGTSGAMIERGGGQAGSLSAGSLTNTISGTADAPPISEAKQVEEVEDVEEAEDAEAVEDLKAALPEIAARVQSDEAASVAEISQAAEPALPQVPDLPRNVPDAVIPPTPEVLQASKQPELTASPVSKSVEPVKAPGKTIKATKKQKPKKAKKRRSKAKTSRAARRGGKADTRRGSSGGRRGSGGGGRKNAMNGRALMSNYRGRVMAHVRRYKRYPAGAMRKGIRGTARVKFTISANGRVISARLAGSSGSSLLDGSARAAIARASPFPPIPSGIGKRRMTFLVPMRFSM